MYLIKTLEKDKVIEENFLYNNLNLASTDFDECDNLFIANFNFKFERLIVYVIGKDLCYEDVHHITKIKSFKVIETNEMNEIVLDMGNDEFNKNEPVEGILVFVNDNNSVESTNGEKIFKNISNRNVFFLKPEQYMNFEHVVFLKKHSHLFVNKK